MIPAAELASIRADVLPSMPDTCTLTTYTRTYDADGKPTVTSTSTTVACRMAALSGAELQRAAQIAAEATVIVTMPANTAITGDRALTVTKAETGEVYALQVLHVNERSQEMTRRVLCKDLNP